MENRPTTSIHNTAYAPLPRPRLAHLPADAKDTAMTASVGTQHAQEDLVPPESSVGLILMSFGSTTARLVTERSTLPHLELKYEGKILVLVVTVHILLRGVPQ